MEVSFLNDKRLKMSDKCRTFLGSIRKGKVYEMRLVGAFYNRIIKDNRDKYVFLDIGANTGSFALLPVADDRFMCYAFEPNSETYVILNENVKLNDIEDKVATYNKAMWIKRTHKTLKVPDNKGDSGLATVGDFPSRFNDEYKEIDVICETVDNFIESMKLRVDAIKIDTEGAEWYILKGGVNTLMKQKPLLLFEYDDKNTQQFGYDRRDIVSFLESCGYNRFQMYKQGDMFACYEEL